MQEILACKNCPGKYGQGLATIVCWWQAAGCVGECRKECRPDKYGCFSLLSRYLGRRVMKFGLFAIGQATGCGRCGRRKSRHAERSSVAMELTKFGWQATSCGRCGRRKSRHAKREFCTPAMGLTKFDRQDTGCGRCGRKNLSMSRGVLYPVVAMGAGWILLVCRWQVTAPI